jgi:predicted DNA binding CopG/RHH family protein
VDAKLTKKKDKHISDRAIDFSDIPPSTANELKRARRVGRPKMLSPKHLIAIRIDPTLLMKIKKMAAKKGKPYQSFIHEILELAAKKSA